MKNLNHVLSVEDIMKKSKLHLKQQILRSMSNVLAAVPSSLMLTLCAVLLTLGTGELIHEVSSLVMLPLSPTQEGLSRSYSRRVSVV